MPRANPRTNPDRECSAALFASLRAHGAACALALIAVLAVCALGACIGPGLEPPKGQAAGRRSGGPGPGSLDGAPDASTPTGTGNFGNAGNASGGTDGDGTTNPENPGPTPTEPPVDMGGQPISEDDEDAGTDPADSP